MNETNTSSQDYTEKNDILSNKVSTQKSTNFHKDFKERVMMRKSSIDLST